MKWIRCSERLPDKDGDKVIFPAVLWGNDEETDAVAYYEMCVLDNGDLRFDEEIVNRTEPVLKLYSWLDESETDNTDEEAAFNAARESMYAGKYMDKNKQIKDTFIHKYETFQDYLKSKQK